MRRNHWLRTITIAASILAWGSTLHAQAPHQAPSKIYWVESESQAISLAQRFGVPILAYATSSGCHYCRKMDRESWRNPQIVEIVEAGFIPLKLDPQRDAETIAALRIRAYPTTMLFSPEAKLLGSATGYLPPGKLAGLLRSGQRAQLVSQQVAAPVQQ